MTKKKNIVAKKGANKKARNARPGPLVLDSQPSIKNVNSIKSRLIDLMNADTDLVVDASKVVSIDTAALQLMVAFVNNAREQSRVVTWQNPSEEFRITAELTDLNDYLGLEDTSVEEADDGLCPVF